MWYIKYFILVKSETVVIVLVICLLLFTEHTNKIILSIFPIGAFLFYFIEIITNRKDMIAESFRQWIEWFLIAYDKILVQY